MSIDSQRLVDFINMFNILWSAPLQIFIAAVLLWQQLGIATLSGITFLLILLPINGFISTKMRSIQILLMKEKDKRVKLMNEILSNIKVLKLYAWENSLIDKILVIREKEIKYLISIFLYYDVSIVSYVCAPFLVSFIFFSLFYSLFTH
jgi:ABC-type multidrug transport system fused ATPase/permease subunit